MEISGKRDKNETKVPITTEKTTNSGQKRLKKRLGGPFCWLRVDLGVLVTLCFCCFRFVGNDAYPVNLFLYSTTITARITSLAKITGIYEEYHSNGVSHFRLLVMTKRSILLQMDDFLD